MQRRTLLSLAALLPVPFLARRFRPAMAVRASSASDMRQQAMDLNTLAANLQTLDDARRLVDLIAQIFADSLPTPWSTRSFRDQIAQAEFNAATDPAKRIPEQHLVAVWNRYAETIAAPNEALITTPELHNLRDGL